jgi:hypothetical protein
MNKNDLLYLKQILRSIEKIGRFTEGAGYGRFARDEMLQSAVLGELMVIAGIAKERLSESLKRRYPWVPWSAIAGMRDKLAHSYLDVSVDLRIVWGVVEKELPSLKSAIEQIVRDIESKR